MKQLKQKNLIGMLKAHPNISDSEVYAPLKQRHVGHHPKTEFKKGHIPLSPFKKGMTSWCKGKPLSEEHKKNLSKAWIYEKHVTPNFRMKISNKMKGRTFSPETRKKLSIAKMGKGHPAWNKGTKGVMKAWNKGLKGWTNKGSITKERRANLIMPVKDTYIEVKIQNFLQQLGIEYFTHKYMNINHAYQCDIFIPSKNMVIECDGNYWHNYPTGNDIDHIRTSELIQKGFKVLRLWEFEINNMDLSNFNNLLDKQK